MAPKTVLITGANRGIGYGLTKSFLELEGVEIVVATCRNPDQAEDLKNLKSQKLHIVQLEVTDDESVKKAVTEVEKIVGDKGLNLLINNAGIFVPYNTNQETPVRADLSKQWDTNISSVIVVTQYFLHLVKKAPSDRKIINISSGVATIATNDMGSGKFGMLAYRVSKTAVNQITKTFAIDLAGDEILTAGFCPGWVQTNMGGPNALLTLDESMADLVPSILKVGKEQNGGYFNRKLEVIPF